MREWYDKKRWVKELGRDPIEFACICCQSDNVESLVTAPHMDPKKDGETHHICRICDGTFIFNLYCWPQVYPSDVRTLSQIIGQVGNIILSELRFESRRSK